jgi:hypothetical protein
MCNRMLKYCIMMKIIRVPFDESHLGCNAVYFGRRPDIVKEHTAIILRVKL